MIKGEEKYLADIAKKYLCSDDGGQLTVAWHATENSYVLRCGAGHYPEQVTREPSLTELHKQGVELPEPIKSNVEKGIRKRAEGLLKAPGVETFSGVPATDLETGELLSLDVVKAIVAYAYKYGLDPSRGHVVVMHGQPYIGIDGYLYHAHNRKIPYSLTGRPLREDELLAQGYERGDLGWYSKVERHDTHQVFEGYGFVKKSELTERSKKHPERLRYPVVAEKPGVMVIKRGDWQVLRRAFPIGESEEKPNETRD